MLEEKTRLITKNQGVEEGVGKEKESISKLVISGDIKISKVKLDKVRKNGMNEGWRK